MNEFQQLHFDAALKENPYLQPLVDRLLAIGGDCVVCWNLDYYTSKGFVNSLVKHGQERNGSIIIRKMERSRCHDNTELLVAEHPKKYEAHGGFGLSDDGLWRPHSFAIQIKDGKIVETTEKRIKYFSIPIPINQPKEIIAWPHASLI